ncbi:MAG: 2-amino-4-hydroxy-6-hydroxymethyldihydropteridine diphosphokinase [Gemmatimonadota bacterium]
MRDLAYVGLGANLGDRLASLRSGVAGLEAEAGIQVQACSSVYESEPVGYVDQPAFYNAVIGVHSSLAPRDLLTALFRVEQAHGRQRLVRWGPRTHDLDLLLWGDCVIDAPDLSLPHPRLLERAFVLVPLLEIAPEARHPVTGQALRDCAVGMEGQVRQVGPLREG